MTPAEQMEVEAVARDLDRFGLKRNAARLRALLGALPDDERPCPVQDDQRRVRAIPWGLAEILYPAYGSGQSLEELARRGGFGRMELGRLAVDSYTDKVPRIARWPLLDLYDMAVKGR